MRDPYSPLITELKRRGIHAGFMRPGQLCLPSRVWVMWKGQWFISTWVPAVYPVPPDVEIADLCQDCFEASDGGSFYTIPERIALKYRLVRLDNEAVDRLIPETEDEDDDDDE